MSLKSRANYVIGVIIIGGIPVLGGLHYFAETGQFSPASTTGGATKSDQRDSAVSNDIANSRK